MSGKGCRDAAARYDPFRLAAEYYGKTGHLDPVTRMQYVDLNLWLPGDILAKADKMTMAHSLELRVPFLDKELFELVRGIPAEYRIRNGTTKYVFRKAMEGVIPDFILNRPKLGFPVPLRDWMHGPFGDRVLEQIFYGKAREYFQISRVETMLHEHRRKEADYSRHLWTLYIFSLWHETFVEKSGHQPKKDRNPARIKETG